MRFIDSVDFTLGTTRQEKSADVGILMIKMLFAESTRPHFLSVATMAAPVLCRPRGSSPLPRFAPSCPLSPHVTKLSGAV